MPQPATSDVHIDGPLTDMATAYFQAETSYAWKRAFPLISTPKQSNKYFVYNKAELLRSDARKRAPGAPAAERNYTLSTGNFFCDTWAVSHVVPDEVQRNADAPLDPEEDAMRLLMQDLNIALEVQWASEAFTTGVWGTDVTGGTNFTVWSDTASSPIENIATGVKTVLLNTGFRPNTLVMGANVWYTGLLNHPDIIARLPNDSAKIATPQFLANLLGLDRVIIGESIRNTAQEGLAASYSANLGSHALLAYVDPNPGTRTPTSGATFNWTGMTGASSGIVAYRIPLDERHGVKIEVDAALDFKVVGSDLGYFFSGAVS